MEKSPKMMKRNEKIIALFRKGKSQREIGRKFGISGQRVRDILRENISKEEMDEIMKEKSTKKLQLRNEKYLKARKRI